MRVRFPPGALLRAAGAEGARHVHPRATIVPAVPASTGRTARKTSVRFETAIPMRGHNRIQGDALETEFGRVDAKPYFTVSSCEMMFQMSVRP